MSSPPERKRTRPLAPAHRRCSEMLVVVALGGSALLGSDECLDVEAQRRHVAAAVEAIAPLAAEHQVVVTHGSAPQVGLLALQNALFRAVAPFPLDVLSAGTEGMVGYLF